MSASYGAKSKTVDFVGLWSWNNRNDFKKLPFPEGLIDKEPLFYHDPYTGSQHVAVLTRTGVLVNVDQNLRIVRAKKLGFIKDPAETVPCLVADLDGDRRPELVLQDQSFFYVLSADFRFLALARGRPLRQPFHVGKSEPPLLCYAREREEVYHFVRLELNPLYVGARIVAAVVLLFVVVVLPLGVRHVRRQAARERAARTNAFRAWTLEAMDTGTVIFDAAGKLVSINRKAREMLALPGQVSGTLNGFAKQLRGTGLERIAELLRQLEKQQRDKIETEFTVRRDGSTQLWLVSAEVLRDNEGRVVGKAVALRDVTETVRSRQVMSWVALARRLAHEVKTPIASILLAAEKIKRLVENAPVKEKNRLQTYFDLLFREIERTRDLAETMMQVTDLERSKREPVDLNAVVREAVELLAPQAGPGVDIEVSLAEDLPPVEGSRAQIALAITNVLKNALQAVDSEGKVRVRTFLAHGLQGLCRSDGSYVAVEIADSGEGIPEDIRDKIFEPYFSRKHSGTGLGLAIVKTVLDDHKGCVEFESAPGVGTTFWLYFPVKSDVLESVPEKEST
ncbi:MAG: PAS domain-containing protein [Calditrichaeota bacterium]|nr:PAS domain-containing protein [Calditrichota bacterium]